MASIILSEIDNSLNWLRTSGIQNQSGEHIGAFNSWYDLENGKYEYAYTEITGYGISTLLFLYKIRQEVAHLEWAKIAAEWILKKACHKSGGVLTRFFYRDPLFMGSFDTQTIFSFDCGMVLKGLVALYFETKDERLLNFSTNLATFLIQNLQKKDGSFFAVYGGGNGTLIDDGDKWSTQSGCYHAKISIGLINLYKATKDDQYLDAAKNICDYSLRNQQDDGRFITHQETGDTLFHAHCYAAEGLYVAGKLLENEDYISSSKEATIYLLGKQKENGGIPSYFKAGRIIQHERSDILGQMLRLAVLHLDHINEDAVIKLINRTNAFKVCQGDQAGGYLYGRDEYGKNYNHINSWSTMFILQGLILSQLETTKEFMDLLLV